jgi:uncharacterized Ntn-hydrolase superfamily protein
MRYHAEFRVPQHLNPEFKRSLMTEKARSRRPVSTYSIVARDSEIGEFGVAVQSHWFSVGSMVPWAESGVGAVATQSFVEPSYGPLGLALMKAGKSAPEALVALLVADKDSETRQVAMVDASGRTAAHTGLRCIAAAGHTERKGFSCQANMMENENVWPEMRKAFEDASGNLAERLLFALEAAEREGGDIRGRQSAALLVVKGIPSGKPWADRLIDIRVEDHSCPLEELRRLLRLSRAYRHAGRGDDLATVGNLSEAKGEYEMAAQLAPEIVELPFWQAISLVSAGNLEEARPILEEVFRKEPVWRELVRRLPAAGLLQDDPELLKAIIEIGK